jgi:hypothetical protein
MTLPSEPVANAPAPTSPTWGVRLRVALLWFGLATLAGITLLAAIHLLADVGAVLGIRGGLSAVAGRLLPVAILSLVGLALAMTVAWLSGAGRRREMVAIAIGFAVLVVIRVYLSSQLDSGREGEPGVYLAMGEHFARLDPDLMGRPPAYSMLLAGAFMLMPDRQLGIESVNLLLGVLAGAAVLGLARGLYGPRAGALALLGYAVWPASALMTVVSIPQIAFDLVTVVAAWAAVTRPPGWRGDALSGGLLALAQYLRPTAPAMLPAWILARIWPGVRLPAAIRAFVVVVVAFLVVLLPVVAYNGVRNGALSISTSDYGGQVLFIGTYEPSGGTFSEEANAALEAIAGPDPIARSNKGTEIAMQRIREDPLGMAALAIRKQDTLWGTEHYGVQYGIRQNLRDRPDHPDATTPMLLSQGFYVLTLAAATAGLFLLRRRPDALLPLAITLIWTVTGIHALLEVRDRHHSYVIPLLLPWAALALAQLWAAIEGRLERPAGASGTVLPEPPDGAPRTGDAIH